MTAKRRSDEIHGKAEVKTAPKYRVVNGRVIGKSIADPGVQAEMKKLDKNVGSLRTFYVEQGILTRAGKLSKRFGG